MLVLGSGVHGASMGGLLYGTVNPRATGGTGRSPVVTKLLTMGNPCDQHTSVVGRDDDSALAERVVNGELTPNAAARARGWGPRSRPW